MVAVTRNVTSEQRFWARVDRSGECWVWTGYVKPNGYASFYPGGGRHVPKVYAHRFSFELANGVELEAGVEIDHTCNTRNCVNPAHLEAVTHRMNLDRAVERRTHCKHGHAFSGDNVYMWRGNRFCRTCRLARLVRGV